ncbi:hypothetical protein BDQ17DRAFT_1247881 [Cyathus striatus]|nr:hypothetical protein BDQ17DRAFT_1247881 [Cyathus striatus]
MKRANETDQAAETDSILICSDKELGGDCTTAFFNPGVCVNVPVDLNDEITSMSIANGYICTIFEDTDCQGSNIVILPPGPDNLKDQQFNDEISSFLCSLGTCTITG